MGSIRSVLLLALIPLAAACLGGDGASPAETPTSTPKVLTEVSTRIPTPPPTPTLQPTPTPQPPTIDLSSSFPQQGGFLMVRLLNPPPGVTKASALFAGSSHPMLAEGDRWFAVVALATDLAPGDYTLDVLTVEQVVVASTRVNLTLGGFPQESLQLPPESANLLTDTAAVEEEQRILEQVYAAFREERLWSWTWIMPAEGPITNPFGLQRSINGGPYSAHTGADIAAESGTPVAAAASGVVAFAGPLHLRGNSVIIDHGAGVFSGYHHLDRIAAAEGESITKGDLVGYVGATGLAGGAHLHWEAIVGGVRVDPVLWTQRPVEP